MFYLTVNILACLSCLRTQTASACFSSNLWMKSHSQFCIHVTCGFGDCWSQRKKESNGALWRWNRNISLRNNQFPSYSFTAVVTAKKWMLPVYLQNEDTKTHYVHELLMRVAIYFTSSQFIYVCFPMSISFWCGSCNDVECVTRLASHADSSCEAEERCTTFCRAKLGRYEPLVLANGDQILCIYDIWQAPQIGRTWTICTRRVAPSW